MTPANVKHVRVSLEPAVGHRVSLQEMGEALGIAPANANRAVREWEAGGPTGPAALALTYLEQGLALAVGGSGLPQYCIGNAAGPGPVAPPIFQKMVVRLWWPRFVAVVERPGIPKELSAWGSEWHPVDARMELRITQWIDDPKLFGRARHPYVADAARHFLAWWESLP